MIAGPHATPLRLVSRRGYIPEETAPKMRVLTDYVCAKLAALNQVARELRKKGFMVTGQTINGAFPALGKPTVRIERGRLDTRELLAFGHITWAIGPDKTKVHYLRTYDGVFVIWTEGGQ